MEEQKRGYYACNIGRRHSCGVKWLFTGTEIIKVGDKSYCWESLSQEHFLFLLERGDLIFVGEAL